jgi:hypothetical protein
MPIMRTLAAVLLAFAVASCSPDPEITGSTGSCAAKLYQPFDRKNMAQCVNVCLKCDNGTQVTCSTSCTLKGAR